MQFSALRYFLETARLGSIRRAAEVLYVAPSAVSRQIALLEQTYGMPELEAARSYAPLVGLVGAWARKTQQ